MKRLKAHKEVVIDHAWLPNEHVSDCLLYPADVSC